MVSSVQIYGMIVQLGTSALPMLVGSDYHCQGPRAIHSISSVAGFVYSISQKCDAQDYLHRTSVHWRKKKRRIINVLEYS